MIYLIALTIFLVALFLFLLIDIRKSVHMLYIIPLTLLFTGGSYFYIDSLFGFPVKQSTEKKFVLLSYSVPKEEDVIFMWVALEGERMPKSVYVPYTQRRHEELMTAQRKMSRGKIMEGNFESLLAVETVAQPMGKIDDTAATVDTQGAGGTNKSQGGGFSLLELKTDSGLPPKAEHANP